MVLPSSCAVFRLTVGPVNVQLIASKHASAADLKPELEKFLMETYGVTATPAEQNWEDVADEATCLVPDGGRHFTVRITLGATAAAQLHDRLARDASERQRKCAAAALAKFGLEGGDVDTLLDALAGLYTARRGLALPEDVAEMCTARPDLTAAQKAALHFASSVVVHEGISTHENTGISTHKKQIVRFSALGAVWEWRTDHGDLDGDEYLRAELIRDDLGVVLQVNFDEFDPYGTTKLWRPVGDGLAAFLSSVPMMSPDELLVCMQCLLGEPIANPRELVNENPCFDQLWPSKHGFSWAGSPAGLVDSPLFTSPLLSLETMAHGRLVNLRKNET